MEIQIQTALIGGLSGLVSGSLITLLGPIISHGIKVKEIKYDNRKTRICSITDMIKNNKTIQEIGESYDYRILEPYFCIELKLYMHPVSQNKEGVILVSINDNNLYVTNLLIKELSRLEKKWKFV